MGPAMITRKYHVQEGIQLKAKHVEFNVAICTQIHSCWNSRSCPPSEKSYSGLDFFFGAALHLAYWVLRPCPLIFHRVLLATLRRRNLGLFRSVAFLWFVRCWYSSVDPGCTLCDLDGVSITTIIATTVTCLTTSSRLLGSLSACDFVQCYPHPL